MFLDQLDLGGRPVHRGQSRERAAAIALRKYVRRIGRPNSVQEGIHSIVDRVVSVRLNVIAGGREIKYMRAVGLIINRLNQLVIHPTAVT